MDGLGAEIKSEDLKFVRHIATSRMARVDLCQWNRNGVHKTVVKKSLVTGDTLRFKKELSSEISILLSAKHENIVEMLGYIHSDSEFGLVMRYYKFGSYHKAFIETNCENPRTEEEFAKLLPLKLRIMEEISSAMHYLHSARPKFVLHLDIKAQNVLMDDDLHAKLADFGLSEAKTVSRLSKQSSCANTGAKGTLFYISPEHLNDPRCKPSVKTDVYAFGILSWQIFTDSDPYEDICANNASLVIHHVQTTRCRPSLELVPACTPAAFIKTVIEESWSSDPEKRPIFAEILERTQQEILRIDNFQKGVAEAVESVKRMLYVPTDVSMPEEDKTAIAIASSATVTPISWEIVCNGIQRRGGLSRLNYGEFPIMATTELHLHGFKVVWTCNCMCVKTGNSTEFKNHPSPFGACEAALRRLIKNMIAKGIYPRPIDEDKMGV